MLRILLTNVKNVYHSGERNPAVSENSATRNAKSSKQCAPEIVTGVGAHTLEYVREMEGMLVLSKGTAPSKKLFHIYKVRNSFASK